MIFDDFENAGRYPDIPYLKEIREYLESLRSPDGGMNFPPGPEQEILGRNLLVRVGEYETGPADQKQFEAHTVYADLQLVVSGAEIMQVSLEKQPVPVTEYNEEADIRFFKDPEEISSALVSSGQFTVFFPGELHKPGCLANGIPAKVRKLVFKISMTVCRSIPETGTVQLKKSPIY